VASLTDLVLALCFFVLSWNSYRHHAYVRTLRARVEHLEDVVMVEGLGPDEDYLP